VENISLNKQIHIYSVDTSCFYNKREMKIHNKLNELYRYRNELNLLKIKFKDDDIEAKELDEYIADINRSIKYNKEGIYSIFSQHKGIRKLNTNSFNEKNIISVFDSVLTRTIQIPENTLSTDFIIVQTYFFDVIEDIILDGFMYKKDKYVCLTASAGQIRTKKTVFVRERVLNKYQNTLMCGLNINKINDLGGVNINKYLAYLALSNSATDAWEDFDITKSIVVEDFETNISGLVDIINDKTYTIVRDVIAVPVAHTDGCGICLPKVSKKNMMVRLPWIKGLISPFSYDIFIKEANKLNPEKNHGIIKDIYNKEHDIIKEGIEIIFTKSQFKMWKYYKSWEDYIRYYNLYNCQAGKCNEEEDEFSDAKINYQMLQTLIDMSDEELKTLSVKTIYNIRNIGKDRKTMLKVLGVKKSNLKKNYFQQALDIYPELLNDTYSKQILRETKKSMVKEARAGKLELMSSYTFIIPDLYAFCENLFLGEKKPRGLLRDGEVHCKIYKGVDKLDCLRSPHLFREHAVRNNVIDEVKNKWFITNGLYTSCHDLISKILQFDVDGDKSLVVADNNLVEISERNMKGIVPLYYKMKKAEAELITNESIYNGLKTAYTGGNIGMKSNDVTKIWNSENVNSDAIEAIKLLCMENNFTIDYAKTLYKPNRPKNKKELITKYTKSKTPHFFIYAKDKTKDKVEKKNNSVVNRLEKIIPNPNIKFSSTNIGKFNYKMLLKNRSIELDKTIIDKYIELDLKKHFIINKNGNDGKIGNILYLYKLIRYEILKVNDDIDYVTDVLVEYLYKHKESNYKTTLWECFGDIIVDNLRNNIGHTIICNICGKRIRPSNLTHKYCKECAKEIHQEQEKNNAKLRMRKMREKNVTQTEKP